MNDYTGKKFKVNHIEYEIFKNVDGYYFIFNDKKYFIWIKSEGDRIRIEYKCNSKFICWLPKSINEKRQKREAPKKLIKHYNLSEFCEICFDTNNLEVHHVKEIKEGGSNSKENLRVYCNTCHTHVHSMRQYRSRIIKNV